MQQTKEVFSILEVVLNTSPSHAFLRSTNTYMRNVLVIAHVFGHADFFTNNHWYRKSNKNMLNTAEQHARVIRAYESQYGRDRVEKLLDALLTVATSVNAFERSPQEQRKRLIYYLEEPAPLEEFERILLEAIREEAEYFDLIQRTHIINGAQEQAEALRPKLPVLVEVGEQEVAPLRGGIDLDPRLPLEQLLRDEHLLDLLEIVVLLLFLGSVNEDIEPSHEGFGERGVDQADIFIELAEL